VDLGLLAGLAGLAVLDSLNTSTMLAVVVIVLTVKRPVATVWAYLVGAILAFLLVATVLLLGASAAEGALTEFSTWARRAVLVALALFLAWLGLRRLRTRPKRMPVRLPSWVNPWSAVGLGALTTASDLPSAFPLFFAVSWIVDVPISTAQQFALLAGYTVVYALPTLGVLVVALSLKDRMRNRLEQLAANYGQGEVAASRPIAALYFVAAAASAAVAVFVVG
jgi:cytochrome c biogenesis protein CcdA